MWDVRLRGTLDFDAEPRRVWPGTVVRGWVRYVAPSEPRLVRTMFVAFQVSWVSVNRHEESFTPREKRDLTHTELCNELPVPANTEWTQQFELVVPRVPPLPNTQSIEHYVRLVVDVEGSRMERSVRIELIA